MNPPFCRMIPYTVESPNPVPLPCSLVEKKGSMARWRVSAVYGIIRQNGGFMDILAEPGLGTTVKLYFPCVEEPVVEHPAPGARATLPGGDEVILLVEDESMVRDLARRILARKGYHVIDAPGGGDAYLLAERHQGAIHLLLTDVVMPKINGRELYERLRLQRPDLKVLFMSGYTDDVIAQRGILDPGTRFIHKPFSAEVLLKAVRRALDDTE